MIGFLLGSLLAASAEPVKIAFAPSLRDWVEYEDQLAYTTQEGEKIEIVRRRRVEAKQKDSRGYIGLEAKIEVLSEKWDGELLPEPDPPMVEVRMDSVRADGTLAFFSPDPEDPGLLFRFRRLEAIGLGSGDRSVGDRWTVPAPGDEDLDIAAAEWTVKLERLQRTKTDPLTRLTLGYSEPDSKLRATGWVELMPGGGWSERGELTVKEIPLPSSDEPAMTLVWKWTAKRAVVAGQAESK